MVSDVLFAGDVSFELLKELGKLCRKACFLKGEADKLKGSIEQLLPIFHEIKYSNVEIPQHRQYQIEELTHKLKQGLELVRSSSASSRWNVYKNIQLLKKLENLEKSVSRFLKGPMQAHLMADLHHLRAECGERFDRLEGFAKRLEEGLGNVRVGDGWYLEEVMKRVEKEEERSGDFGGVALGNGLKVGKEKVKEMLIRNEEARVVGISGIGGSGKTTLAKEICRDHQIRRFFNNRVFFETVSQCPNLERLKLRIWEHIYGSRATNPCDPIPQWKLRFEQKTKGPTLVVLDDVWSLSQLEQLIIKVPGCKILVVSRFRFPEVIDHSYEVELLGEEESVSLFCYSAFQQHSIPLTANKKLVNQIVSECKGLPLALKVIGASLKGQLPLVWESAKNRLSKGETISESHDLKLLERMAISIDFLSAKVRECFLDLGSFPEDKKISLDVLLNMWVETHDLDEVDAFAILLELCDKNLLSMVKDPQNRAGEMYCSFNEFWVSQHDVLRDLALQMNNSDGLNRRKRLIMPRRDDRLPKDWQRYKDEPFDAQIVSIHTGEMKEVDWFHMYFPNAEVLVLNLTSNTYFLPPFMKTMPKLKSLILLNSGNNTTILRNLSVFPSLYNLTSLWLEKVTVPPLHETVLPLPNLQKISLVLCDLNKSLNGSLAHLPRIFPRLSELIIDYSIDLKKLPSSICEIPSLESLSITNCHDLLELPAQLDHLSSLQVLRIYACPSLKKLPPTICGLKRLKYLDISQCVNLRDLPEGMGQLLSLEKIDMRECSQIMHLPQSTPLLKSLGHVICDEEIAICWKEVEKTIPELRIQVAEECFTLDWLVG